MFRHVAIIVTTALLATACDEQSFDHADPSHPSHPRPTVPDRAELDELADDEEGEETGDAGMDGVDELPDAGTPDNDPCCFCMGGPLPECLSMNAEECAAYEAATGLESCDPTFNDCACS